jgi:hypothetical protein
MMNNKQKAQPAKKRREIMRKAKDLIENKSLGMLLLTEIDKKGNDIIHSFTYKCDEIHSKKILALILQEMPELKEQIQDLTAEKSLPNPMVH